MKLWGGKENGISRKPRALFVPQAAIHIPVGVFEVRRRDRSGLL